VRTRAVYVTVPIVLTAFLAGTSRARDAAPYPCLAEIQVLPPLPTGGSGHGSGDEHWWAGKLVERLAGLDVAFLPPRSYAESTLAPSRDGRTATRRARRALT
jgi:hypothetical protein